MSKIPKFIILEWINWCWKSSVWKALWEILKSKGYNAIYKHFPDEQTTLWKTIRELITDKTVATNWSVSGLLYAAEAEYFHLNLKNNINSDNDIYILDRHSLTSSFVYQYKMTENIREKIYLNTISDLKEKWKIFILDLPLDLAIERYSKRNETIIDINKKNDSYLSKIDEYYIGYKNLSKQLINLNLSVNIIDLTIETTILDVANWIASKLFH